MVDWFFNGKYIFQRMIPRFSELNLALFPIKLVLVLVDFQGLLWKLLSLSLSLFLFFSPFWSVKNVGSVFNISVGIVNMHMFSPICGKVWQIYYPKSLGQCCLVDLSPKSIAATILSNSHAFLCTPRLSFKFVVIGLLDRILQSFIVSDVISTHLYILNY